MNSRLRLLVPAVACLLALVLLAAAVRAAESIPQLIQAVNVPAPQDPAAAASQLAARKKLTAAGARAVPALLALAASADAAPSAKIVALTALSEMKPGELAPSVAGIAALLTDPNPGVRYLAAKTLGIAGSPSVFPAIQKLVKDADPLVRMSAADVLGQLRDQNSVPTLLSMLDDSDETVRVHAIQALGNLGIALVAVPELVKRLESANLNERGAAVEAIDAILGYNIAGDPRWGIAPTPEARKVIIGRFEEWWKKALSRARLTVADDPELQLRVNILLDPGEMKSARLKAASVLGRLGNKRAVDYLVMGLSDKDADVRKDCAEAITTLSGRTTEFRPAEPENEWLERVDAFRSWWRTQRR